MNDNGSLHVVFGASGSLGNAVVRELVERGQRVRAVNRSGRADVPAGVELISGDAMDPSSTRATCEGAAVVYNCTNVPYAQWEEKMPALMAGIIEGAASAGAKLVYCDNLYMYGQVSGPITEDMPYGTTTRKGRTRARIAESLMQAHESGRVQVTIGRASDAYGPLGVYSFMGERVFEPMLAGKTVSMVGNLDMPHTYIFNEDFASGLATLGERDEALGQIWNIPSAETLTTRELLTMAFDVAGEKARMRGTPSWLISGLGIFSSELREVKEMLYEFEEPFIVDHSKYEQAFGSEVTPHREALQKTLDWFRQRAAPDGS